MKKATFAVLMSSAFLMGCDPETRTKTIEEMCADTYLDVWQYGQ